MYSLMSSVFIYRRVLVSVVGIVVVEDFLSLLSCAMSLVVVGGGRRLRKSRRRRWKLLLLSIDGAWRAPMLLLYLVLVVCDVCGRCRWWSSLLSLSILPIVLRCVSSSFLEAVGGSRRCY